MACERNKYGTWQELGRVMGSGRVQGPGRMQDPGDSSTGVWDRAGLDVPAHWRGQESGCVSISMVGGRSLERWAWKDGQGHGMV